MSEKFTIQDIARMAGVSKATVSRVLNHNPIVSAETSARVMKIVQEYKFVPNITATGLAGGKTRLVGVLVPPLNWVGISEMLRGVAEYIEKTSYEIILYSISFERNHSDILKRILSMRLISGLLAVLPGELTPLLYEHFYQGLPLVMINDQIACGVLEIAEQQGIRVPRDIALVGFDDNPLSARLKPSLTTICQPFSQMGYKAIEQLLTMIDANHRTVNGQRDEHTEAAEDHFADIHIDQNMCIQLPAA